MESVSIRSNPGLARNAVYGNGALNALKRAPGRPLILKLLCLCTHGVFAQLTIFVIVRILRTRMRCGTVGVAKILSRSAILYKLGTRDAENF